MQKLNRVQRKIAWDKHFNVAVIKGKKESGKTTLAMARMIYLLEHGCNIGEQVLFISPKEATLKEVTAYLGKYYQYQNINLFGEDFKARALVKSTRTLAEEVLPAIKAKYQIVDKYPQELVESVMQQTKKVYPRVKWLKQVYSELIGNELMWINAHHMTSLEDYQKVGRRGTKVKLSKKGQGRQAIWLIKTQIDAYMKQQGLLTEAMLLQEVLKHLKKENNIPFYKHLVIDDAQQLTKVELDIIYTLWEKQKGAALFLLDPESNDTFGYLDKGKGFKNIGFEVKGRVKKLSASKKKIETKKKQGTCLTPLEMFLLEQEEKQKKQEKDKGLGYAKSSASYIETYKFINKITGVETIFQKDSSAGETYIDERKQEEVESLPIYSDIAAGLPIEIVDEMSGQFDIPSQLMYHRKNSYILHVQGDSMVGVDICDGDYVVIQGGQVTNHEIAAVYYNGATTLKRIVQEKDHVLLMSENPKYDPIKIEEGDFRVMGRLVGVIKELE